MRKASKIIFLVAGIVSIVIAVNLLITGLIFVILPNTEAFKQVVQDFIDQAKEPVPADFEKVLKGLFIGLGVCFFCFMVFAGINSFLSFKAFREEKPAKPLCVLNIVFGVVSLCEINIVAAIFAFIANGQESRRAQLEEKK